ncbi:heavy-metal-associated domain-containing protein [Candidatus Woesearchaeota archaeon]|nr:heavy-metal-associated domain-containing protein [Candidatus Woesearchaeota archaeon]
MKFQVEGMHCKSCKMLVQDSLEELGANVVSIEVDEKKKQGRIIVNTTLDQQKIIEAIEKEGSYKVKRI